MDIRKKSAILALDLAFFAMCSFSSCFEITKKNSLKKSKSIWLGRREAQSLSPYSTEQLHQDEFKTGHS